MPTKNSMNSDIVMRLAPKKRPICPPISAAKDKCDVSLVWLQSLMVYLTQLIDSINVSKLPITLFKYVTLGINHLHQQKTSCPLPYILHVYAHITYCIFLNTQINTMRDEALISFDTIFIHNVIKSSSKPTTFCIKWAIMINNDHITPYRIHQCVSLITSFA